MPIDKARAKSLLREWQYRLELKDWLIVLKPACAPDEMFSENVAGCTEWAESIKTAVIQILDPQYYGERIRPFDFEKTLVHELLHLKLALVSDGVDQLQQRYMHQIIDDLARAMVSAKRR